MWKIKWEHLKLSHTIHVSQNVPTERKRVELLFLLRTNRPVGKAGG